MTDEEWYLKLCRAIAVVAHRGQVDKAGVDYIHHPAWVAGRCDGVDQKAAAWLHDVLEDTKLTVADLLLAGVRQQDIDVVELLTRKRGQADELYYAAIRENPVALAVKLRDIEHNTLASRLATLPLDVSERLVRKYAKAGHSLRDRWNEVIDDLANGPHEEDS